MSFLAPLFLFGALAVAAPIILHLIRRTSREKMTFSSLMFLQPTPPRMTRQSRLENIFLLILRCLVLCLLAFGFARPFLQKPVTASPQAGEQKRIVLLVDASASMKRDGLWPAARAKAEEILRAASPLDAVAVLLFDRTARPLVSFEQWASTPISDRRALALKRLAETTPGWSSTHLGHALNTAVETLEDSAARDQQRLTAVQRRIVLISDLQEGARLDGLQGFEWPRGIEVVLDPLKPRRPTNAGLHLVTEHDEKEKPATDTDIKVHVSNSSVSKREQFQIGWVKPGEKAFVGAPLDVYVPPGQSRVVTAPKAAGDVATEQLRLTGDEEDFDNLTFHVPPKPEQIKVLFLGADAERDPAQSLYYLKRAFQETRRQIVQIVAHPPNVPVPITDAAVAPLLIVSDVLSDEGVQTARNFLASGKTVLFAMSKAASAQTIAQLAGIGYLEAEEATTENYALLGQIDFEHPLFASFADPRFSDFSKIHFWKHRRIDPGKLKDARVLARFDKGDAALLQMPGGKGTLLVLTSGWHPADSQLALSSKFVPLLYSILELSGGVKAQLAQYIVGDSVPLALTNAAAGIVVLKPDGSALKLAGPGPFSETDLPGIYTVTAGQSMLRFAVNLDPIESKTAPLPVEELERLGLPLKPPSLETVKQEEKKRLHLQATELEQQQKLWRWLLVAALVVLLMETALAGWLTRRASSATT